MKTDLESKELILCQDKEDLADKAARSMQKIVSEVLSKQEICNIALSGGSTPKLLYERLLRDDLKDTIEWSKIAFYVSDERCVEHDSADSNYGNAYRELLQPLKLAKDNLHPTEGQSKDADKSATDYENAIRKNVKAGSNGLPRFDIVFLGMGPDGHTASLFPGTTGLSEEKKLVIKNHVDKVKADRITFTFPLINSAANEMFLVA
jgi:6-phosphogluconolactonase